MVCSNFYLSLEGSEFFSPSTKERKDSCSPHGGVGVRVLGGGRAAHVARRVVQSPELEGLEPEVALAQTGAWNGPTLLRNSHLE